MIFKKIWAEPRLDPSKSNSLDIFATQGRRLASNDRCKSAGANIFRSSDER